MDDWTQLMSGSSYPTMGLAWSSFSLIRAAIEYTEVTTEAGKLAKRGLLLSMADRCERLPVAGLLAVALNPGTKGLFGLPGAIRTAIPALVKREALLCAQQHFLAAAGGAAQQARAAPAADNSTPSLLSSMAAKSGAAAQLSVAAAPSAAAAQAGATQSLEDTIDAEWKEFSSWPEVNCSTVHAYNDALGKWRVWEEKVPNLARLARRILIIPATAASVEGLWSQAGDLVSRKRSNFTPRRVEQLVFLRSNKGKLELAKKPPQ
jgi:hypothetical protein